MNMISSRLYNGIIGGMTCYGLIFSGILAVTCRDFALRIGWIPFVIGYVIFCISGVIISKRSSNPILNFFGYNLIVLPIGSVLSVSLANYNLNNITSAMIITGCVTAGMLVISMLFPYFFEKIGLVLALSLVIGLITEVVAILCGYSGTLFDWLFVLIFSLYIGYDWNRAQTQPKTVNTAMDSAIDIYIDIIGLFTRILKITADN